MSNKSRQRKQRADARDSKKFFTVVGVSVAVLMLLMFLIYRSM